MNTQQLSAIQRPGRDAEPRLIDYAAAASSFRLDVPERFNPVLAIIEQTQQFIDIVCSFLAAVRGRGTSTRKKETGIWS
jgi:hypothetical protein